MKQAVRKRFEELFSAQLRLERTALHLMNRADSMLPRHEVLAIWEAAGMVTRLWRELEAERKVLAINAGLKGKEGKDDSTMEARRGLGAVALESAGGALRNEGDVFQSRGTLRAT